jgi:urea transport system permease protein
MLRILLLLCVTLWAPLAGAQTLEELAARLPAGDFDDRERVIAEIAATGDPAAIGLLEALAEGDLAVLKSNDRLVRIVEEGRDDFAFDYFTGEAYGEIGRRDASKVRVNNSLRRAIDAAIGMLTLGSPDPALRIASAESVFDSGDPDQIPALDAALEREADPDVAKAMREARAAAILNADAPAAEKVAALNVLGDRGDRAALSRVIAAESDPDPAVAEAATETRERIEQTQALWDAARNIWFGLSLGSVLMLAAIGLAITFGVMGVINMAHGELVMLGAYTTYAVQEVIRNSAPGAVRLVADHRAAAGLPRFGRGGRGHRARRGAVSLRPPAGDAAGHLGRVADPATGGALAVRADQQGGRQPLLDVGRLRGRAADHHL